MDMWSLSFIAAQPIICSARESGMWKDMSLTLKRHLPQSQLRLASPAAMVFDHAGMQLMLLHDSYKPGILVSGTLQIIYLMIKMPAQDE